MFCKIFQSLLYYDQHLYEYYETTFCGDGKISKIQFGQFLIFNFQTHVDVQNRDITPYFNSVINSTFSICKFFNGSDKNPVAKWIFDSFASAIPKDFIHSCPYIGELKLYNVTIADVPQVTQFLHGTYRSIMRIFDGKDDNILTIKHEADIL